MASREEIREGVDKWLKDAGSALTEEELPAFLTYLDSEGVVLKVEGELPDVLQQDFFLSLDDGTRRESSVSEIAAATQQDMLKEGYSKVERLIEAKDATRVR